MGTSSANPDKLDDYSTNGLELVETLGTKSNAVMEALDALRGSGSRHVPALGDADATLADLVDDWFHLDEFVGDVALGFARADDGEGGTGGVLTIDDGTLASLGEIGYADRDAAIAAAEAAADELTQLQEEGASAEEIDAFIEMTARGMYDPAFAVTFSERAGVDGYADATAMIRAAYINDGRDLDDAIPQVQVLATLLTTALDTRPGIDDAQRHDPSNAALADDARLDAGFVSELTTGYQPDDMGGVGEHPWGYTGADDLSVLLGLSDPPTDVAIDIAENRMKPLIEHGSPAGLSMWHDDYRDPVVNYATMLARNDDAAAGWLHREGNLELLLDQAGEDSLDGGAALADVVEAALTNPDMRAPVPGAPSYVDGGLIREDLMDRAIELVGGGSGDFDIQNEHMYDALASGVEHNMTLIDERINRGWSPDGENYSHSGSDDLSETVEFLSEVMADDSAADRVRSATFDYVDDELAALPVGDDGLRPRDDVHDSGRMLGSVMEAELAAINEAFEDDQATAANDAKLVNFAVGWVPYLGDANAVAELVGNTTSGSLLSQGPDSEQFRNDLADAEVGMDDSIDGLDIAGRDMDAIKAAVFDLGTEIQRR
jgi:hypothetical protein